MLNDVVLIQAFSETMMLIIGVLLTFFAASHDLASYLTVSCVVMSVSAATR